MKLTAQRETTIGDVEPGELIVNDGIRLIVDEVRRKRDGVEVYCVPEGSESTRRSMVPFKTQDQKVTVEAGPEDGTEILGVMHKLIAVTMGDGESGSSAKLEAGQLAISIFTRKNTRAWKVVIEA